MNHLTQNQTKVFVEGYPTFGLLDPTNSLGFKEDTKLDVSDIDLTTKSLDSRITFNRASQVAYFFDGGLEMASVDVWPLEVIDGVVKGRHQPENAATNYQLQMKGDVAVQFTGPNAGDLYHFQYRPESGYTVAEGLYQNCGSVNSNLTNFAVYNATTSTWIKTSTSMNLDDSWKRIIQNFSLTAPTMVRTYNARLDSTDYVYGNAQVSSGQFTSSFYATKSGDRILTGYVQVEAGLIATSPIFSQDTAQSRAAAYAWVLTQGQSGCTLHFDNGDTLAVSFTAGDMWQQLPFSTVDWATRFITRISYNS